ncbi:hypothetical protein PIB30_032312 [Stylosanthes scabra]|uniref:Uncharacterized protein n=1 Tax=Stylosanthes scabra TaxID=79078 RepID=A0ABU6QCT4_9FABA|nr:hypothetical protein [Stylosanthes scabra]
MAERSIEEIAAEDRRAMYRLNTISHVAHNVYNEAVEAAGTSTQADLPSTPQTQGTAIPSSMSSPSQQAFLDRLSSPEFQQMISDIMPQDSGYRPDT